MAIPRLKHRQLEKLRESADINLTLWDQVFSEVLGPRRTHEPPVFLIDHDGFTWIEFNYRGQRYILSVIQETMRCTRSREAVRDLAEQIKVALALHPARRPVL